MRYKFVCVFLITNTNLLLILSNIRYDVLSGMKINVCDAFYLFSKQFHTEDRLWRDK